MFISHGRDPHILQDALGLVKNPRSAGGQARPWPCCCLGLSWAGRGDNHGNNLSCLPAWEQWAGELCKALFSAFASCAQAATTEHKKGADLRLNPTTFWEQSNGMLHRHEVQVKTGKVK